MGVEEMRALKLDLRSVTNEEKEAQYPIQNVDMITSGKMDLAEAKKWKTCVLNRSTKIPLLKKKKESPPRAASADQSNCSTLGGGTESDAEPDILPEPLISDPVLLDDEPIPLDIAVTRNKYGIPVEKEYVNLYKEWFDKDSHTQCEYGAIFAKFLVGAEYRDVDLKRAICHGIPASHRAECWGFMTNAGEQAFRWPYFFEVLLSAPRSHVPKVTRQQIFIDIFRTYPDSVTLARDNAFAVRLERVLMAYALHNAEVSYCFTEEHQILTDRGFMFLDEVEAHVGPLCVAGYDEDTRQIVFEKPLGLVVNPPRRQNVVEFSNQNEAQRWTETSGEFGVASGGSLGWSSNGVSVVCTPEHRLWARRGSIRKRTSNGLVKWADDNYVSITAGDLLEEITDSKTNAVRFLAHAEGGVRHSRQTSPPFVHDLCIHGVDNELLFCKLYGYWLADGTLCCTEGRRAEIRFTPVKHADQTFLVHVLSVLEVQYTFSKQKDPASQSRFSVSDKKWVRFFQLEYGHIFKHGKLAEHQDGRPFDSVSGPCGSYMLPEGTRSSRWMARWVWTLSPKHLQHILLGLRLGDGDESTGAPTIYTSSARFRDEIVRVALLAGYTSNFRLQYKKGVERGPVGAVSSKEAWRVTFHSRAVCAKPRLKFENDRRNVGKDIARKVDYTGRTWCFRMPSDFVVVRRAHRNDNGAVTKASHPMFARNCQGMNFIAGGLLRFMSDNQAFWTLKYVVEELLPATFGPDLCGVRADAEVFVFLASKRLTKLNTHFTTIGFNTKMVVSMWMTALFGGFFPMETTFRIWDFIFYRRAAGLFDFMLCLFKYFEPILLEITEEGEMFAMINMLTKRLFDITPVIETAMYQKNRLEDGAIEMRRRPKRHRLRVQKMMKENKDKIRNEMAMRSPASANTFRHSFLSDSEDDIDSFPERPRSSAGSGFMLTTPRSPVSHRILKKRLSSRTP